MSTVIVITSKNHKNSGLAENSLFIIIAQSTHLVCAKRRLLLSAVDTLMLRIPQIHKILVELDS